jgi:hypothetical protein
MADETLRLELGPADNQYGARHLILTDTGGWETHLLVEFDTDASGSVRLQQP